jgi:hypothetical protein
MMWWWHGSGWGWITMMLVMFAFWGLVIWAVVAVARSGLRRRPTPRLSSHGDSRLARSTRTTTGLASPPFALRTSSPSVTSVVIGPERPLPPH